MKDRKEDGPVSGFLQSIDRVIHTPFSLGVHKHWAGDSWKERRLHMVKEDREELMTRTHTSKTPSLAATESSEIFAISGDLRESRKKASSEVVP